jgi:pimeloyl-ACP methyl ester carboxylesterase
MSATCGVLEPLQAARTIDGQLRELEAVVCDHALPPVALVGWSWGAWLGVLFAARHPALVGKLILVASGPFEQAYAERIMKIRFDRLSRNDSDAVRRCTERLDDPRSRDKDAVLSRLASIFARADAYDPGADMGETVACQYDVHERVWNEAKTYRNTGLLLSRAGKLRCGVVALHGDYDPHPAEGVSVPLGRTLSDFRFVLLENCGHRPWIEKRARDRFFDLLTGEIARAEKTPISTDRSGRPFNLR